MEQKLLEIFIERLGTSVSRLELSKIMGGLSERSIDVQITRIRNKLEDNPKEPKYLKTDGRYLNEKENYRRKRPMCT